MFLQGVQAYIFINSANGDSLGELYWEVVEGGRVLTYEPGTNPVLGPDYIDNIQGFGTGTILFFDLLAAQKYKISIR